MTGTVGTGEVGRRAGRREWAGLAVLALPCLLYSMDLTVLYLAVPALTADLAPSAAELLWITDVYGFLLAGSLLTMGTLGDRIGRRRLLLIGAAAFGTVSLLAALATNPLLLIAARALLGVAAGALAPSTLSLIRALFPDARQRSVAIGVWAASFSVGAALGPVAGGLLLEFFWWGSVFLLAVPVMVLLLATGPRLLPEYRDPAAGRLDLTSAALSVVAVLTAVSGLKTLAEGGRAGIAAIGLLVAVLAGALFARRQGRLAAPLVELRLFRSAAISTALLANLLSLAVFAGFELFLAQYLQLGLGLSPLPAGAWTVPAAGGLVAGSLLAPQLTRVMSARSVIATGLAVAAAGFAMFGTAGDAPSLGLVVAASVVVAVGIAPVGTLGADIVVGTAPPQRAGTAAGLSETSLELGGALGIATLGSLGMAVYHERFDGPDTLGATVDLAGRLPAEAGAAVLAASRAAFGAGMQAAAITCLAACAATAVLVLVLLPRRPTPAAAPRPHRTDIVPSTTPTDEIRELLETWADAVRRRDLDGVCTARAADVVLFDVPPPAVHTGAEAYRRSFEQMFPWLGADGRYTLHDLAVTAGGDVGFAHALVDCRGTRADGSPQPVTVRLTVGLRRVDERWVVTHEHHSEPSTG